MIKFLLYVLLIVSPVFANAITQDGNMGYHEPGYGLDIVGYVVFMLIHLDIFAFATLAWLKGDAFRKKLLTIIAVVWTFISFPVYSSIEPMMTFFIALPMFICMIIAVKALIQLFKNPDTILKKYQWLSFTFLIVFSIMIVTNIIGHPKHYTEELYKSDEQLSQRSEF